LAEASHLAGSQARSRRRRYRAPACAPSAALMCVVKPWLEVSPVDASSPLFGGDNVGGPWRGR
jgi:hypothetical protein